MLRILSRNARHLRIFSLGLLGGLEHEASTLLPLKLQQPDANVPFTVRTLLSSILKRVYYPGYHSRLIFGQLLSPASFYKWRKENCSERIGKKHVPLESVLFCVSSGINALHLLRRNKENMQKHLFLSLKTRIQETENSPNSEKVQNFRVAIPQLCSMLL